MEKAWITQVGGILSITNPATVRGTKHRTKIS